MGWVNIAELSDFTVVPEDEDIIVMFNSIDVDAAKEREMKNWYDNEVFEEVENVGQKAVSVRWVITEKTVNNSVITKARLVARGFEENTLSMRKDSPTCTKESIRLALSIASCKKWEVNSIDVKAAYLQGNAINRDVYLKPPPEYFTGKFWKLKKTVYGLCDAGRAWYMRVNSELQSLSLKRCSLDPSLFLWYNNDCLSGIICLYVDDFLWTGCHKFYTSIIVKLWDLFLIGSSSTKSFKYIGLNISTVDKGLSIDQYQYASILEPIKLSHQRASCRTSDLSESEKSDYRALLGQLNWLATNTRPDVSYETTELSVNFNRATVADMIRLNKLVSVAKSKHVKIVFPRVNSIEDCILECYADSSFANLSDGGSQGGYVIFLRDSMGIRCPLLWQSRKIRRVVKSTLSAEALALLDCAESAVFLSGIIREITGTSLDIYCVTDCKSLHDALQSSNTLEDRRLRIDLAVLRDMLDRGEISKVSWVATSRQLADCLTKRGACAQRLLAAVSGN